MEPLPWVFRSVKAQKKNQFTLDSPELAPQCDTIFVNASSGNHRFGFHYLKKTGCLEMRNGGSP